MIDTQAVIEALQADRLGGLAIDVYEGERNLFFEDRSGKPIQDEQFVRLLAFPNVLITGHQGFFTTEALTNIAASTVQNLDAFERTGQAIHEVGFEDSIASVASHRIDA